MGYTGINLENVKMSNRSAILKILNDRGAMSRKDIAMELGLTPATVTLICTELIAADILYEKGEMEGEKRAGRKKVLIDINYQYRYVLTIDIAAEYTCVAISDLKGNCLALRRIPTDGSRDPDLFLKSIADEGKALMWESGIVREKVLGVGVSVPGPVDRKGGISKHAYRIWSEPVPVGEILKNHMGYPVIVENNVNAFAVGELIYGIGRKRENLLFIKWGPGVGSAIIIDNKLYESRNFKAAEIGHYIMVKNGRQCRCGRKGCLETRVSRHPIAERVREACSSQTMPVLYQMVEGHTDRIVARNMEQWITAEDEGMWKLLDALIEEMAMAVVNTITLIAPEKVIYYGSMFDMPHFPEKFVGFCSKYDPSYDDNYIRKSKLSDKIEYIGPLAVAVNELFLMAASVDE